MSEWKEYKLSDVAEIIPGYAFKSEHFGLVGMPIIKITDIEPPNVNVDNAQKVDLTFYDSEKISKYYITKDDFIVAMTGATIGKIGRLRSNKSAIINQRVAKIKPYVSVDHDFIYFTMSSIHFQDFIQNNIDSHSAQENISGSSIGRFPILLPPLSEQKAIAGVLSNLDDKIDLLQRQNKTLEGMAEALWRKTIEDESDDWEEVDLEYVAQRITDGAHNSPPTADAGMPMASVKDMHQWGIDVNSCRKISEEDYNKLVRDDCRPLKNDILIAKDGSYLKHIFVAPHDLDLVILSSIAIVRPNGKYHPLLLSILLKMDSTKDAMQNIVTGAVIPRIVLKDFRKFKIQLPPLPIQITALKTIEPFINKCWVNIDQINSLNKIRNSLLPKLMSGEVRVNI